MFFMPNFFYEMHYNEGISKHLDKETKKDIAERISALTLAAPIWLDKDKDYSNQFPEIKPYVNTILSGLFLCAIMSGIVKEFQEEANARANHLATLTKEETKQILSKLET